MPKKFKWPSADAECPHAEGLYTEMDFRNEGLNMIKMQQVLDASEFFDSQQIVIPKPFMDISSRSESLSALGQSQNCTQRRDH